VIADLGDFSALFISGIKGTYAIAEAQKLWLSSFCIRWILTATQMRWTSLSQRNDDAFKSVSLLVKLWRSNREGLFRAKERYRNANSPKGEARRL